jgi:hypothetical protein
LDTEISWRCQFAARVRPRRDNDYTEGALGDKRRQVNLDIVDVIVSNHPWAIVWIAEETESFRERNLRVGRICRSDMIDDVCLDTLPGATIHEEGEFESERLSDTRSSWINQCTSI